MSSRRRDRLVAGGWLGGGARLPFSDNFNRADGDLGNNWEYTAGKWTISSNAALGTPGLGANLVLNPGFDADTNWGKETGWSIGGGVATKAPSAGNADLFQNVLTASKWVRVDWTITTYAAGVFWLRYGSHAGNGKGAAATYVGTNFTDYILATVASGATGDGSVDNVTFKYLTDADIFCTREFRNSNVNVEVPLTLVNDCVSGIVLCLDDKDTPANYIVAFHNGASAYLVKCVAGAMTQLIKATATYAAGAILRASKLGDQVSLYYNEVQAGTTQTVSDAGIVNNTCHGMFSTYSGNLLASFTANPT